VRGLDIMKRLKLTKLTAASLIVFSALVLSPIGASAEWKEDSAGRWYSNGASYDTGWQKIDGKWYYFYSTGYMAHDTKINGYYLDSNGVWTDKAGGTVLTPLEQQLIDNVKAKKEAFDLDCTPEMLTMNNLTPTYGIAQDELEKLYYLEMSNIAENRYTYGPTKSGGVTLSVKLKYYDGSDYSMGDFDVRIKAILSNIISAGMSDEEKELAIHDWIIKNIKYDESYKIHDGYKTLIEHKGVCEGYSELARRMFTLAGIKTMLVIGTGHGAPHAWNLVYINNKWQHVDCTWDASKYVKDEATARHKYYNITDSEISYDHNWDKTIYPSAE
jgi:hypothetical protein